MKKEKNRYKNTKKKENRKEKKLLFPSSTTRKGRSER